jgi:hypothetical protein
MNISFLVLEKNIPAVQYQIINYMIVVALTAKQWYGIPFSSKNTK